MKVKICGITNVADARAALLAGADFLGLIFAPSPRNVTVSQACRLIQKFPRFNNWVGVFVNEKAETVAKVAATLGLKYAQLHGEETPAYCKKLIILHAQIADKQAPLNIIKALRVRSRHDVLRAKKYRLVFAVLLDAYSRQGRGGTGEKFNWQLARNARKFYPRIFLSGGLTPANVAMAIKIVRPAVVDVASGVELRPGKKSYPALRAFIRFAKNKSEC
ncbi:MAG: phosphoribosylanthranilate isomerase [Candidatus Margulisiibacteriota bacterium]